MNSLAAPEARKGRGRCSVHDLALAPDGTCTLCRRSLAPPKSERGWLSVAFAITAGIMVLAVVAGVTWKILRRSAPPGTLSEQQVALQPAGNAADSALASGEAAAPAPASVGVRRPMAEGVTDSNAGSHSSAKPAPGGSLPSAADSAPSASATIRSHVGEMEAAENTPRAFTKNNSADQWRAQRQKKDTEQHKAELKEALRKVSVTMYSTSWCGVCDRARRWFTANQIPFVEKDVERDAAAARRYRLLNPRGSVPTIDIDGQVAVGFSAARVESMLNRAAARRAGR